MIRKYKNQDVSACMETINSIWNFDNKFKPQELSNLFKDIYISSSLSISNYAIIIEEDNSVQGFLFGNCGKKHCTKTKYSGLFGVIRMLIHLSSIKEVSIKRKREYITMLRLHEKNRKKIEADSENEVNLFAVKPGSQGKGFGKALIMNFINHCKNQGAARITLETDQECNYKFYHHLGFKKKAEFFSPLQKEYTGASGVCFLFELKL